jgi:adenylate cyclase
MERRLVAIMAADVVGYSRLMGTNEAGTLADLKAHRKDLVDAKIAEHQGRIVKLTGDGLLAEFSSVVNAVACAVAVQRGMSDRNASVPPPRRIEFRIGVNLGDVIVEGDDIFGDGVNVAVRLEGIAQPGGIAVSGPVRDHIGNRLDIAFDDLGEQTLKNIERPVRVFHASVGSFVSRAVDAPARETQSEPLKPSIAVLPFENLSGDPEQGYFADGITEDIITDLSKVSGLFVIARNSSFAYKGRALDIRRISRELGVRYVLEGSVRRAGRIRINAQLIDATTGGHIWAERYDRELEDIFAVQDEVTRTIVGALKVKLTAGEEARRGSRGKVNPEAYDLLVRASQNILQFRPEALKEARVMLQRAIELDGSLAVAYARLSIIHSVEYANRWNDPRADHLTKALSLASKAVELDENEPKAHDALAIALLWSRRLDEAERAAERMIELDPNYASGYLELGNVRHFKGKHESAVELYRQANRLDPQFDLALHFLGRALLTLGRFDEAEAAFKRRLALVPRSDMTRFYLASLYGHAGRHDEARQVWRELLVITPDFSAEHFTRILPYRDPSSFDWFVRGVHKAGIAT